MLILDANNVLLADKPDALAGLTDAGLLAALQRSHWAEASGRGGQGRGNGSGSGSGSGSGRRAPITVVFDGGRRPLPSGSPTPAVSVVFSGTQTADAVIARFVAQCDHPRQLTVVSHDKAVQKQAKTRRCQVIGSTGFLHALVQDLARDRQAEWQDRKAALLQADTAYWLRAFGYHDQAKQAAQEAIANADAAAENEALRLLEEAAAAGVVLPGACGAAGAAGAVEAARSAAASAGAKPRAGKPTPPVKPAHPTQARPSKPAPPSAMAQALHALQHGLPVAGRDGLPADPALDRELDALLAGIDWPALPAGKGKGAMAKSGNNSTDKATGSNSAPCHQADQVETKSEANPTSADRDQAKAARPPLPDAAALAAGLDFSATDLGHGQTGGPVKPQGPPKNKANANPKAKRRRKRR